MQVFRIQPQGADLHGVETETSNGEPAGGVHVFSTLAEVAGCFSWLNEKKVELATIECATKDLRANGDFEGDLLIKGRGKIVFRMNFDDVMAVARYAEENA